MIVYSKLREKYNGLKRNKEDINRIVLHGTGGEGDTAIGVLNWMVKGGDMGGGKNRISEYEKGISLFPYLIDWNGDTYEVMPDIDWYGASGCGMMDKHTMNIEIINKKAQNKGDYSDDEYTALFKLISTLLVKYPTITIITEHDYQRKTYSNLPPKNCIGDHFKWKSLEQWLKFAGINDIEILR